MDRPKIAVLFGGRSEEHEVSIKSAGEIAKYIDTQKYEPVYIGITKSGVWKRCHRPCPKWEAESRSLPAPGFADMQIDAVFPVIHGKTGEDGKLQGLLEMTGVPYVGCDIQSSVLCMDKSLAYMVVKNAGLHVPEHWVLNRGDTVCVDDYPVFVKPARSGSSFGVTRVCSEHELSAAVVAAEKYDSKVLIERAVSGVEVGCAVLGNSPELTVGEVDQITLSHGFFRIHQEAAPETGSENAVITVPAALPDETRRQIKETAKAIYTALGCRGLARVDMFLREDGRVVFNEVNTMPGFTSYSRYPRMMAAAGITLAEVIDRLIMLALRG